MKANDQKIYIFFENIIFLFITRLDPLLLTMTYNYDHHCHYISI